MRYISTGGQTTGLSFRESLFTLYAPDGGLLMPESVPHLAPSELEAMSGLTYLELCIRIGSMYIDPSEIDTMRLTEVLTRAYATIHPDLESPRFHQLTDGVSVLEMFNTPTLCFKDYAMCFTTALMNHFLELKKNKPACVSLVATSGDTGGSAIRAVESLSDFSPLRLIVLLPEGRVSAYQRVAMTTSQCRRVRAVSVAMDSDRLDDVIRAATLGSGRSVSVCTQNSANWGRILFQIPAFFYAYFRARQTSQRQQPVVKVFVPTGGCGNLTAGCLARRMGLPYGLYAATNQNGAVHALISSGRFQQKAAVCTTSVAMDIANPYNIPRLLSLIVADRARLLELVRAFDARELVELTDEERRDLSDLLVLGSDGESSSQQSSMAISDPDCQAEVIRVHLAHGYLICPHTACALAPAFAHYQAASSPSDCVAFATAHPAKFADLYRARGLPTPTTGSSHPILERLAQLPERYDRWDASMEGCVAKLTALIEEMLLV